MTTINVKRNTTAQEIAAMVKSMKKEDAIMALAERLVSMRDSSIASYEKGIKLQENFNEVSQKFANFKDFDASVSQIDFDIAKVDLNAADNKVIVFIKKLHLANGMMIRGIKIMKRKSDYKAEYHIQGLPVWFAFKADKWTPEEGKNKGKEQWIESYELPKAMLNQICSCVDQVIRETKQATA
jgi:hypothetical protein